MNKILISIFEIFKVEKKITNKGYEWTRFHMIHENYTIKTYTIKINIVFFTLFDSEAFLWLQNLRNDFSL